jgi:phosphoribosylcarboxyaminoimidazole (NCAIR) mutase
MDKEAMAKLKTAMLEAETAAHLAAIIIDYTHEEIMMVFQELEAEQQERIKTVWKTVS